MEGMIEGCLVVLGVEESVCRQWMNGRPRVKNRRNMKR